MTEVNKAPLGDGDRVRAAFTAVQYRTSLQHESAAPAPLSTMHTTPSEATAHPAPSAKDVFDKDVKDYTLRAFYSLHDPKYRTVTQAQVADRLRSMLQDLQHNRSKFAGVDFATYPLPQDFILEERREAVLQVPQTPRLTNHAFTSLSSSPNTQSANKKRKSFDEDLPGEYSSDHASPATSNRKKPRILAVPSGQSHQDKFKAAKTSPAATAPLRTEGLNSQAYVLEKRAQRFANVSPNMSPYTPSSRPDTPDTAVQSKSVVGTCQEIEKDFYRLTEHPPPQAVRPLHVLQKALELVGQKWKAKHDYNYARNQLKSIRQDLTVQQIKHAFTVKAYEAHARIALEVGDMGEYNMCQTQLRGLYKLKLGGNPVEFTAYRILYMVYTRDRSKMNTTLAELTAADKQEPAIRDALAVRSALASGNYHKFFKLWRSAPHMGPYLIDQFVERERIAALAAISRGYKQDVGIRFVAQELAFNSGEDVDPDDPNAGLPQCAEFIMKHGGEHLVAERNGDIRFLSKDAITAFEAAKARAFGKVDIKGQI